jgi:hypothetical protein
MSAYHHEEGFLLRGNAKAIERATELFGRLTLNGADAFKRGGGEAT